MKIIYIRNIIHVYIYIYVCVCMYMYIYSDTTINTIVSIIRAILYPTTVRLWNYLKLIMIDVIIPKLVRSLWSRITAHLFFACGDRGAAWAACVLCTQSQRDPKKGTSIKWLCAKAQHLSWCPIVKLGSYRCKRSKSMFFSAQTPREIDGDSL